MNDFTEPTTNYWQEILSADALPLPPEPPFRNGYPARLPDGRHLMLPIRKRPGPADVDVASLIPNQASFSVISALAGFMAELARPMRAEAVVGMPTLGLALAPQMAAKLCHSNYVPLGYSRKFWYRDELSEPVTSITSPGDGKRVYLDPNLLPRIAGRRIVLTDDTISSGSTATAVLRLFQRVDTEVVGVIFAMKQGDL